jgi:transposase
MHFNVDVTTNFEIDSLTDLPKLKILMENLNMKINKSMLAREMGVDRRTIDRYLKGNIPKITRKRSSKIDEYYPTISVLLSKESKQRFFYKRILWQYLTDNHRLDCAQSSFRSYISKRPEFQSYFDSDKGSKPANHIIRFETPPAEQAQLDWKEDIRYITKDGEIVSVNVCVLLLSFSRFRTYHLSISKSQSVLFSFLMESFEAIGGVPKTILTDNMKTVMDVARTEYKKGVVNERFDQFSKDCGFEVRPCIAGRPRTKAKVEAPMKLIDEIHAYQGQFNYEELHQFVQKLCNRINTSYHQGTGKIPVLALEKEKDHLVPLPRKQLRDLYKINHTLVKVNTSNMISYKSNQYSVPAGYKGKTVGLQVYDDHIYVHYNTDLLVEHRISNTKINYKQDHYLDALSKGLPRSVNIDELAKKNLEAISEVYRND